jgi:hypothetical protein
VLPNQSAVQGAEARNIRLHEERVRAINDRFARGRRVLLARALNPENNQWAQIGR